MGRQTLGAWVNGICYPLIGLPISWYLSEKAHLGLRGIWLGETIGVILASCVYFSYVCFRVDWQEESNRAVLRTKKEKDSATFERVATHEMEVTRCTYIYMFLISVWLSM